MGTLSWQEGGLRRCRALWVGIGCEGRRHAAMYILPRERVQWRIPRRAVLKMREKLKGT